MRWFSISGGAAAIAALGLAGIGVLSAPPAARAQDTATNAFPDIPQNHWAYQAVSDLAAKGYVKGYPNGDFLGQRALTRYEFATVLARMLGTINDLSAKVAAAPQTPPQTPTGQYATIDDINKIQTLLEEFRKELADIKATVPDNLREQLNAIRQDIADTKAMAAKAQTTANNSYGFGAGRKFLINGFLQARYSAADSSDKTRFPQGNPAQLGNNAYNGTYAQGGAKETFFLRRARLRFSGQVTDNTRYAVQLDALGNTAVANASTNVTVRETAIAYTFGTGDPVHFPTLTVGLFPNYFGSMLATVPSDIIPIERPLGFNEGPNGLFASQDFERGAQVSYGLGTSGVHVTAGLVNGTGLSSNDNNDHLDGIYRVGYQKRLVGLGASYYDGEFARPASGSTTFIGPNYQGGKKQVYDFDAHYTNPSGLFVQGEYLGGTYEQRAFFATPTALTTSTEFVPGNKVEAYYAYGGWTFFGKGAHPLSLVYSYDVFRRSKSGAPNSGSAYDDVNQGYGVLYSLDKQTRLRIWYTKPDKVAHAAGTAEPPKIGLLSTEIQVKF